jgi:hypothetical protein
MNLEGSVLRCNNKIAHELSLSQKKAEVKKVHELRIFRSTMRRYGVTRLVANVNLLSGETWINLMFQQFDDFLLNSEKPLLLHR